MAEGHPLVGRTLEGRFRLTGFIGEGAMASVLRAVDLQNGGTEVAVKVMHPHLAEDRTFAGRFKREAKAAAMLKHPNSVTILHFGEDDRIHYIAMELVRGKDLREVLKAEKRLSEVRACKLVASICEALEAAHKLGIVHRDLKPENVMVERDPRVIDREQVKVLDFGIAKLVDKSASAARPSDSNPDSEPPPALTQVGVVVGTPAYMSPEQCRGQPLDGRSDLYTCGILLYQLVTGRVPFDSDSPFETAGKQAFEAPPRPSQFLPTIDPGLEALILRTLAKSPDERPASAAAMRDALLDLVRTLQSKLGKTMPMMASKPIIAAAEARAAQLAAQGQTGPQQGSYAGPAPQGYGQPPLAPAAGAVGPRGTLMQSEPHPAALFPQQGSFPPAVASSLGPSVQQNPGQPFVLPQGQAGQGPPPQGPPPIDPAQMAYGGGAPAGGAGLVEAEGYPKAGYPKAPSPKAETEERSGVGGGLTFLFVLLSVCVGVGLGFALFRLVGAHG